LEGIRKEMKVLNQYIRFSDRDLNPVLSEYKAVVITTKLEVPSFSFIIIVIISGSAVLVRTLAASHTEIS
jgi:hypothetical protein